MSSIWITSAQWTNIKDEGKNDDLVNVSNMCVNKKASKVIRISINQL